MLDSTYRQSNHNQTFLFQKIRNKILVSIIEIRSKTGYQFAHPSKFNIEIPLTIFEKDEIEFLRVNQMKFSYCDVAVDKDYFYPCYELKGDFLLTNEINLSSLK